MTYAEVATKNGWTYEKHDGRFSKTTRHVFRNGETCLEFTRRGHGHYIIRWRDHVVPWHKITRMGSDQSLSPTWISGEEFADIALPQITAKECQRRIEARLRAYVADAKHELANAEQNLAAFIKEIRS